MSDTPRTDANVTGNSEPSQDEYEDLAQFARQLERENRRLFDALEGLLHSGTSSAWAHGQAVLEQSAEAFNRATR